MGVLEEEGGGDACLVVSVKQAVESPQVLASCTHNITVLHDEHSKIHTVFCFDSSWCCV